VAYHYVRGVCVTLHMAASLSSLSYSTVVNGPTTLQYLRLHI
jgi:hypothetical protein